MIIRRSLEKKQTHKHSFAAANDNEVNIRKYISNTTLELDELSSYFGFGDLKVALIAIILEAHANCLIERRN